MSPITLPPSLLRSYDRLMGWVALPFIFIVLLIAKGLDELFTHVDEDDDPIL